MNDDAQPLECGKTIEELSDYLAAGRLPFDPSIESCPECLNALQGLAHVSRMAHELIAEDAAALPAPAKEWLQSLMSNVHAEVRAGRSLPLPHPNPRVHLTVTEGAVRALVRSVGDDIPGLIVGKCDLAGDLETPGAPVEVTVTGSIGWGWPVPEATRTLRALIFAALATHTALNVVAVHVTIADLHGYEHGNTESP